MIIMLHQDHRNKSWGKFRQWRGEKGFSTLSRSLALQHLPRLTVEVKLGFAHVEETKSKLDSAFGVT